MNLDLFMQYFGGDVRVLLNWGCLGAKARRLEGFVLTQYEQLESVYLPWYTGAGGEVPFDSPSAVPICLSCIPSALSLLKEQRQSKIRALSSKFNLLESPVQLTVPLYSLGTGKYLLLDRCHRMAALSLSKGSFKVLAFAVTGPIDTDVLPDLLHWK